MNKVAIGSLRPDTYINQPVFMDGKYILLAPDIVISEELVERLRKWDYQEVQTDGVTFEGPSLHESTDTATTSTLDTDAKDQEEKKQSHSFFDGCVEFLDNCFADFREINTLPLLGITEKLKEIISELKGHKHLLLNIDTEVKGNESYITHHSIKTTFLVLSIADFLKFPAHKQIEIGIAAMLHKLGMLKLPSQLYEKKGVLTPKEFEAIRTHPVITYKILKAADFPLTIYMAVLEQNENMDGSGYPRQLGSDKISAYGKILAVSSAYAAATTKRPFREELDGHSGIIDLLRGKGTKYDESTLRALVFIMSIYPVGTFVQLSNQVKAIVIKTNLATPRHPILMLLLDESGVPYTNRPVLQTRPEDTIQITGTLNKEEILELKSTIKLPE